MIQSDYYLTTWYTSKLTKKKWLNEVLLNRNRPITTAAFTYIGLPKEIIDEVMAAYIKIAKDKQKEDKEYIETMQLIFIKASKILDDKKLKNELNKLNKLKQNKILKKIYQIPKSFNKIQDCMIFHQSSYRKKQLLVKKFAIAEFLQLNNLKTWIDKLNFVKHNFLTTQLSLILKAVLTGKEKGLYPFWTKHSMEISQRLWLPIKTDYVDSDLNSYNTSLINTTSHSWFSMKKQNLNNKSLPKISYPSLQSFKTDITEKENTVVRTKKIRLFLNQTQKQKFKQWICTGRYLYNKSIKIIKDKKYNGKFKLRTQLVTNYEHSWELDTPQGVREGAVFDACDAYNSNLAKYKITKKPFDLKFRKKKDISHTITLPVDSLNKNLQLYPKFLSKNSCLLIHKTEYENIKWKDKYSEKGKKKRLEIEKLMKNDKKEIPKVEIVKTKVGEVLDKVIRIQYTNDKKWYLCVPIDVDVKSSESQGGIISLDPGVRTFLTGYSPNGEIIKIGDNDLNKIRTYLLKTDKFISKISKMTKRRKKRSNIAKRKRFNRVINWIKDCHRKTVKYLIDNYNYIIIPPFNVKNMVNRKNRKINNKTVRNMLTWSHYKFRMMLLNKSEEYNDKHIICPTEEYTSKTCGRCGNIKYNLGGNKVYNCKKCGLHIDRDINGSRNILIKYLTGKIF